MARKRESLWREEIKTLQGKDTLLVRDAAKCMRAHASASQVRAWTERAEDADTICDIIRNAQDVSESCTPAYRCELALKKMRGWLTREEVTHFVRKPKPPAKT